MLVFCCRRCCDDTTHTHNTVLIVHIVTGLGFPLKGTCVSVICLLSKVCCSLCVKSCCGVCVQRVGVIGCIPRAIEDGGVILSMKPEQGCDCPDDAIIKLPQNALAEYVWQPLWTSPHAHRSHRQGGGVKR